MNEAPRLFRLPRRMNPRRLADGPWTVEQLLEVAGDAHELGYPLLAYDCREAVAIRAVDWPNEK